MKKIFSIVLVLSLLCAMFAVEARTVSAAAPSLSVEVKSANEIVVTWENVTQEIVGSPSAAIQIRQAVDPGNLPTLAYGYVYNSSENHGASGSVTFSNTNAGSTDRQANFPLVDGKYYAVLRLDNGSLVASTRVDFTVGTPPSPPELSVTVNSANEIVVNWKNVSQTTIGSPSTSVQIRKGSDTGTMAALAYHYVYNTSVNNGETGSVTFSSDYAGSEDRKANFPLEEGAYYAVLRMDNGGLLQDCRADFYVGEPELSVEVKGANEIVVNWKGVTEYTMGSPSTSIQLRKASDTGTMAALAYNYVYNTSENNGASGTLTFSNTNAGSEDRKANFPLAAGDYYVICRLDNGTLVQSTRVNFTVAAAATETPAGPTPSQPTASPAGEPKITVEVKSKGEVKVKWENITQEVLGADATWASLQIRPIDQKEADTCTGESSAWVYIYNNGVLNANGEYTFTVGGRLADGSAYLFDEELEAGTYFAVIRTGPGTNYLMDCTTDFTVQEAPTQTGDGSLMVISMLVVASAVACVMIRRKIKA